MITNQLVKSSLLQKRTNLKLESLKLKSTTDKKLNQVKSSEKNAQSYEKFQFVRSVRKTEHSEGFEDLFEMNQKLGKGANANVFRAIQKNSGKQFAVKIPKRRNQQLINGVKNCYLIMKELDHPQVLKAEHLFIDETSSTWELLTELCNYPELDHFIQSHKARNEMIQERIVAKILTKIFQSLEYLKQKGVCHRDLHPHNILYNEENGDLKIIDFELSRIPRYQHQNLDLWSSCGCLAYRAPESFIGGYGCEVDMWAVGVIAYKMLVGNFPFQSPFQATLVKKITKSQIDFSKLNISTSAKRLLKGLLEKNPTLRLTPEEALCSSFILENLPINIYIGNLKLYYNERQKKQQRINQKYFDQDHKFSLKSIFQKDKGIVKYIN